jgi:alkylhydroperoxidase family enzyme
MTAPRIPIPAFEELRHDVAEILPLTAQPGRATAQTMAILARQPSLFIPFLTWAAALALEGALEPRDHELLALRTAWRCQSTFEWDEHVEYARRAGLRDDEITAIGRAVDTRDWTEREAALLQTADELVTTRTVTDPAWSLLAANFDAPALVEILFVVGQYTMLSMVANAAGCTSDQSIPLPRLGDS